MYRVTIRRAGFEGRRRHLAITGPWADGWALQWANPTEHGYLMEPPVERGLRTKREAVERKRQIVAGRLAGVTRG